MMVISPTENDPQPMAYGTAYGLSPMADGRWLIGAGLWSIAYGLSAFNLSACSPHRPGGNVSIREEAAAVGQPPASLEIGVGSELATRSVTPAYSAHTCVDMRTECRRYHWA